MSMYDYPITLRPLDPLVLIGLPSFPRRRESAKDKCYNRFRI